MITVAIILNGQPLMARSAVRTVTRKNGNHVYACDDGSVIEHQYSDGAVALAKKMLDTIVSEVEQ